VKVLHVNAQATWGGGEQQTLYLLEGLQRAGVEQALVCRPGSVLAQRASAAGVDVREEAPRGGIRAGAAWRLGGTVRDGGFTIVHAHDAHAHGMAWSSQALRRWRPGARLVVSRRVVFSIYRHGILGLNHVKYATGVDRILCASGAVRDALVADRVPERLLTVVHDGIDLARVEGARGDRARTRAALGPSPGAPWVGTVGNLVPAKGHAVLLDAFAAVRARRPDARLLVAGVGPLERELREQAERLGVADAVRFLGFVPEVLAALASLDVFAFPSLAEGLGTSALDAMALGVPVVASRAGGIPEVVEDRVTGLLVPPGDAPALAAAIEACLADPGAARDRAGAARARVEQEFTAERMSARTLAAYEALEAHGA
jgi:glycosyltransferase involved in cell wall biosynthesis